jgi:hypothetical protein
LKPAGLILPTLLCISVIGHSFAVVTPIPIPSPKSFVGYGGEIMLPLLNGANFSFYVGEELWIMAIGDTTVWLSNPDGYTSCVATASKEPQMFKRFTESDSAGNWLLEHNSPEGPVSATIDLQKYVTFGPAKLGFNLEEDKVSASIERDSQSLVAFLSEDGLPGISPGEIVGIEFGTNYSGSANIRILSEGLGVVEGKSDNVSQRVEVSALVAYFTVGVLEGHVEFRLPNIHEVGPGGLFPLRYGSITVEATPEGSTAVSTASRFYVFPARPSAGAKLSSRLDLAVKDALHKSLEMAMLYQTDNTTATASSIFLSLPVANIHVVDERHDIYLTKGNFSLKVDSSQVWYDNDSAYVLYSQRAFVTKEDADLTGSLTYELKIRGFTSTELGPRTISLKPGESVFIATKVYELKLVVEDLYGNPVKADLSINGTAHVSLMGETKLSLPVGHYSLEVNSDLGIETRTVDIENDVEITFRLGQLDPILILLIAIGVVESLAIMIVALRVRRLVRRHYKPEQPPTLVLQCALQSLGSG